MAEEKKEELTLEENFAKIQAILDRLEEDDISLEDAFRAYRSGMELIQVCNGQIDQVEKQVLALSADGKLEAFS